MSASLRKKGTKYIINIRRSSTDLDLTVAIASKSTLQEAVKHLVLKILVSHAPVIGMPPQKFIILFSNGQQKRSGRLHKFFTLSKKKKLVGVNYLARGGQTTARGGQSY